MESNEYCYYCNIKNKNDTSIINSYYYEFKNNVCEFKAGLCNPNFNITLNLLCEYYIINNNRYIKKCCYNSIQPTFQHMGVFKEMFITSTLDFSNYVRIKLLEEYDFDINMRMMSTNSFKIIYSGKEKIINDKIINDNRLIEAMQTISFLREINDDAIDILKSKLFKKDKQINELTFKYEKLETDNIYLIKECKKLNNELSKRDKLNKRLVNLLTIYKYHELNNVQKYDYQEIKEKNKKLNQEFKRVAKLMKLNK